ncbi:hypothetical protein [Lutibacter citreus]|uniref:hypothetical protein n=1 Tax=Lutibacter citreus TaxID=2138210 RepID=UPI000DBE09EC|nr:hypothetical protein [Lutibacter citreus]
MENSYDVTAIEEAFEQVITNRVFKRSSLQERILRYLINQALAENDVSEHSIGFELFKEKYTADQNDSKIRVYVFYLRKKLAEYYNGTGKNESIIFYVEKGQYNLTFKQNSNNISKTKEGEYVSLKLSKKVMQAIIALFVISISLIAFFQLYKPTYIWQPFFKDNTLCVIADHYMVANHTTKNSYSYATFPSIYSEADVSKFKINNPELNVIPASFTMTTKMASFGVHYLDEWFHKFDKKFDVQLESDTQLLDYTKKNVIYIGQAKKMQESKTFFLRNSKVFGLMTNGFIYKKDTTTVHYTGTHDEIKNEEYAMISFQKLDNGMFNIFFVSNHDIGVMGTIKMFTSKEQLKDFVKKLPSVNSLFNALFKVNGLNRTEMSIELVELEVLSD